MTCAVSSEVLEIVTSATACAGSWTVKRATLRRELSDVFTTAAAHVPRLSKPSVLFAEGMVNEKLCEAAVMSALALLKLSGSLMTIAAPSVGAPDTFTQTVSPRLKEFFGVEQSPA